MSLSNLFPATLDGTGKNALPSCGKHCKANWDSERWMLARTMPTWNESEWYADEDDLPN